MVCSNVIRRSSSDLGEGVPMSFTIRYSLQTIPLELRVILIGELLEILEKRSPIRMNLRRANVSTIYLFVIPGTTWYQVPGIILRGGE